MSNRKTARDFLKRNNGKLYAALPSLFAEGSDKPVSPRRHIANLLGIDPHTVYIILTGRLEKTFASDETIEKVLFEAINLLRSGGTLIQEYETFFGNCPQE